MASRYWVGGTGTWDASDTTHWSATSGGAGGASVPSASDAVTFDSSSNAGSYSCTLGANASASSLTIGKPASGALTFNAVSFDISAGTISISDSSSEVIVNMGSGFWKVTGASGSFNVASVTQSLNYQTSTIEFTDTSASEKDLTVRSADGNIYNLKIDGGFVWSFFNLNIKGSLTVLPVANATHFRCSALKTIVVTGSVSMVGASGNVITVDSNAPGAAFTISKASGIVNCNYLSLKDSTATGGASFYAGPNSTNVSGNTGWIFTAPSFSVTKSLQYTVVTQASPTKSLQYAVVAPISATKSLQYTVVTSSSVTKSLQYSITQTTPFFGVMLGTASIDSFNGSTSSTGPSAGSVWVV